MGVRVVLVDTTSIVVDVFSEEPETPQRSSAKTRLVRRPINIVIACFDLLFSSSISFEL
jgi:hypothetical protein